VSSNEIRERNHLDYLRGLKHGAMLGFASWLFGTFIQVLAQAVAPNTYVANPIFVALVFLGGVAFGFLEGAGAK
jgi:polyferredoxin